MMTLSSNFLRFLSLLLSISKISTLTIDCEFEQPYDRQVPLPGQVYSCKVISDPKITQPGMKVTEIAGKHTENMTNSAVKVIEFRMKTVNFMPVGLGQFLDNLTLLLIDSCKLTELTPKDMAEYPKLEFLWLEKNSIEVLAKDTFKHNKELHYVNMNDNKLRLIDGKVFDDLKNLKFIHLLSNDCIKIFGHGDSRVKRIQAAIKERCSGKMEKVGRVATVLNSWVFWVTMVSALIVLCITCVGCFMLKKKTQ